MFELKKASGIIAVVALTCFGGASANATTFFNQPGETFSPLIGDFHFVENDVPRDSTGNGTIDTPGSLVANTFFSESFFVDAQAAQEGNPVRLRYDFNVDRNTGAPFGIANLTFDVIKNGVLLTTFQLTGSNGVILAGATSTFLPTFQDNDLIEYVASGTPFLNGGYSVSVQQLAAVPIPPSIAFILAALVGLGVIGRNKKALHA